MAEPKSTRYKHLSADSTIREGLFRESTSATLAAVKVFLLWRFAYYGGLVVAVLLLVQGCSYLAEVKDRSYLSYDLYSHPQQSEALIYVRKNKSRPTDLEPGHDYIALQWEDGQILPLRKQFLPTEQKAYWSRDGAIIAFRTTYHRERYTFAFDFSTHQQMVGVDYPPNTIDN